LATIKTAISIDEDIFNEVESMTKKLHISRSQFYSQAAKYMIQRNEDLELLQKINSACNSLKESDEEKTRRKQEKAYHAKKVRGGWK
jgi:metal-responsive CopG/Arc/MetJ family transcriptional regulator